MIQIVEPTKEIVIAVVSNPNFFTPTANSEVKIKLVCELIRAVEATVNK